MLPFTILNGKKFTLNAIGSALCWRFGAKDDEYWFGSAVGVSPVNSKLSSASIAESSKKTVSWVFWHIKLKEERQAGNFKQKSWRDSLISKFNYFVELNKKSVLLYFPANSRMIFSFNTSNNQYAEKSCYLTQHRHSYCFVFCWRRWSNDHFDFQVVEIFSLI